MSACSQIRDIVRHRLNIASINSEGTPAMSLGTVKIPTLAHLGEVAAELGLSFSEADLAAHLEALRPSFEAYNILDRMPDEHPSEVHPHLHLLRPLPLDNKSGIDRKSTRLNSSHT